MKPQQKIFKRETLLSDIDSNFIRHLVNNNPRITVQETAKRQNVDNSNAFRHLKQLGCTSKVDIWIVLTEQSFNSQQNEPILEPVLEQVITGDEK